jgi:hypothetical protein
VPLIVDCVCPAGMNADTHTKVAALSCGHDHAVHLVEDDGTLFLENDAVEYYKLKRDDSRPVESRVYPSRMVARANGILLENSHDPSDMGYLGNADPHDWPKVLLLLQGWGWGGNTVLVSNGSNGASHDQSYFDRTLCCKFWRKHRDRTGTEVTGM